ncbi:MULTISPECIES: hypothetical protein [Pseudomonas]|uniref:hypothetical protein n=1 Tax=Pseudomonas TaxID=286 RepID=UPI001C0A82FE|nr:MULTISPECIES: hypothetical protein [Pseudomonas]MCK3841767.1 hypothetical protein [Pseudomonas sp. NCIMB 10586]VCU63991.1 Hypothetical new protein [Pseudomonas synxantha]
MKKSLLLALSKYNPIPETLRGTHIGQTVNDLDVDLAGLYHHYYMDNYGIEPPSPDPAQFEYLRFLMPDTDFRFQGGGLTISTSARRSTSTQLGQAFCRWFMHEHLGIKYFAHMGSLIGTHSPSFHGFAVERSQPGDTPDYLCSAGSGSVAVAEAKGRYTPINFKNKEFDSWRQQFTRIRVLDKTGTPVSVKGHIVATRFATEYRARVDSKLYAEDPITEGQEPISQQTEVLLSKQIAASHYADVLLKLDQPHMSHALRNQLSMESQIRITATIWEFSLGKLGSKLFVGGYHGGRPDHQLIELVDDRIVHHRSDLFRLGAHSGTFVGLELSVFKHLVQVCRGADRLLEDSMPEVNSVDGVYSGVSMLRDGSIIGPLPFFNPSRLALF